LFCWFVGESLLFVLLVWGRVVVVCFVALGASRCLFCWYSESCLNRTLNKPTSSINRTLNKSPVSEIVNNITV
jgi:hypothetical protein